VYQTLGHDRIVALSTAFYTSVYSEPHTELGVMFQNIPIDQAIQNQYEFFVQRLGGPQLFSERKGHPALRARHAPFRVTEAAAEAWLLHMRRAVKEVLKDAPKDVVSALHEFFNHTAYFLINTEGE
jgi:truncated hemoglobin YjbI